jgi:hypothetical protein
LWVQTLWGDLPWPSTLMPTLPTQEIWGGVRRSRWKVSLCISYWKENSIIYAYNICKLILLSLHKTNPQNG